MTRGSAPDSGPSAPSDVPALPDGTLVRSKVEPGPSAPLAAALDRELTGYAVLEPQDALLLDADGAGVVGFEDGVPRFAYHAATGAGGPDALAALAAPGPYDVELRGLPAEDLDGVERPDHSVPPGMPADRLAGDPELAERTRAAAPPEWESGVDERASEDGGSGGDAGSLEAVEAFLDDEQKVAAIRDRAREEARERAEEWGLDDELE